MISAPRLIFWEITQNCNLSCPYCRREDYSGNGLKLEDSLFVVDSITKDYKPLLIFSGGEPLTYPFIFEVVNYAHKKGINTALATNGTSVDLDLAKKIKSMNFHRVAVSLDGANEEAHDFLRGKGSFSKTISAIKLLKLQGVELQINTTVLKRNFDEPFKIYKLCEEMGIKALHIFAFVPVGCGINIPQDEMLSKDEYENFLQRIAQLSINSKIEIRVTCAPHYNRILAEKKIKPYSAISKGCLAGTGVCFISNQGEVYPCGYLPISCGNIFKDEFKDIWENSFLFQKLRHPEFLLGRCKICEYVDICSGCRARAYAATGNFLDEEPECNYQPLSVKS